MPPSQPPAGPIPVGFQPIVAAAVLLGILAMAGWFLLGGGFFGGLVTYDRPPNGEAGFTVDINAAGAIELAQLPGLGPATAERIVAYRMEHGAFASHEDLLAVTGIGPITLESLRPFLRPIRPPREAR